MAAYQSHDQLLATGQRGKLALVDTPKLMLNNEVKVTINPTLNTRCSVTRNNIAVGVSNKATVDSVNIIRTSMSIRCLLRS